MVKANDLAERYNVSIETIRRDLEDLENQGYLERVYGGAIAKSFYGNEPHYQRREVINLLEKQAIAKTAATLIGDGDIVFIDVGTTTLEVVKFLNDKKDLVIITNSTLIAHKALGTKHRVILLGGEMRQGEYSVSGSIAEQAVKLFNANKAIIGVGGIHPKVGITDYDSNDSAVRRAIIKQSHIIIAITDYSKFGVIAMNNVCGLDEIDYLVVDESIPKKVLSEYNSIKGKILRASIKA